MSWLKDKLVRNIVLGVIGLGLLVGVYFWVQSIPESGQQNSDDTPQEQTPQESIELLNVKNEDIKEIFIKNPDNTYTIHRQKVKVTKTDENGQETTEEKDGWGVKEYPEIEFSSVKVENAVYDFASVYAEKEIEDADLQELGLTAPVAQSTVYLNDGSEKTLLLGNKVAGGSGYFGLEQSSGKVYVLPTYKAESMLKKLNDYRDTNLASLDIENIKTFTLKNPEGIVVDIRAINEEEKGQFSTLTTFVMTNPKYESVKSDTFGKMLEGLGAVNVSAFVEDAPADLSKYGLDAPVLSFTLADQNKSYTIHYGKKTEDGLIYAMMDGKNFVFTQEPAMYDTLIKVEPLGMLEKFAHIIDINKISEVSVEGGGIKHTMSLQGEEDAKMYFVDGKEANDSAFKKAYQQIIGLMANGFTENKVQAEPDYIITFVYKDGTTLVAKYIPYDERNYALEKNGSMEYTVLKKNLQSMMQAVESLAGDPMKQPE